MTGPSGAIPIRTRLKLHRKLEAMLGTEEADTLLGHLPPVSWNEVSTKDDLATLGTTLHAEARSLGTELPHVTMLAATLRP